MDKMTTAYNNIALIFFLLFLNVLCYYDDKSYQCRLPHGLFSVFFGLFLKINNALVKHIVPTEL